MRKPNNIRDPKLKVQQHHAVGSSAREIMARHSGRLPPMDPSATVQPQFVFLPSEHYHEMMNKVADVKSRFASLTARERSVFQNEPYQWLRYCENPKNREECLKRGWVTPSEEEQAAAAARSEDARMTRILEGVKPVSSAKPDDEAQPNKAPAGASVPPQKGGNGG